MVDATDIAIPGIDGALAEALAKIEIPPRPAVLDQVMAEMKSDEPDFRRLASLIMSDVGLSAVLIKTANAPIFGYRTRVGTVREALTMLGLVMVLRTVAAYAARQALPETPSLKGFWDTSARVAHLSGWLARELGIQDGIRPQDAYTYGLFRDCGIPVLSKVRDGYDKVLAAATGDETRAFTEVESAQLTLNHAMVGSVMARSWYLPDTLCDAILHHHDAAAISGNGDLSAAGRRLVALAQLAEKLQGGGAPAIACEWNKLGPAVLDALEIGDNTLERLQAEADDILKQLDS